MSKQKVVIVKKIDLTGPTLLGVAILAACVIIFMIRAKNDNQDVGAATSITSNVSEVNGTQIIEIGVKGGYRPNISVASAGKNTTLKLKTSNTFDCSASISIPALNVQKYLPQTGTEEITIPAQSKGSEIRGTCAMGMYNFRIKFI